MESPGLLCVYFDSDLSWDFCEETSKDYYRDFYENLYWVLYGATYKDSCWATYREPIIVDAFK